jgi:hypothetical protein
LIVLYIIAGLILLLVLAFLLLRASLTALYAEGGLKIWIQIFFVKIMLYPEKKDRAYITTKKTDKEAPEAKKGGSYEQLTKGLPILKDILGKLKRKLIIDELIIWFLSAAEDPAAAALGFGAASAGAGILNALIDNHFEVKKRDIRTDVSFTEKKSSIYVKVKASVPLRQLRVILSEELLASVKQLAGKEPE